MNKYKVCIDLGHGGKDPGAEGNGLVEKTLNLKVGLKVKELLAKYPQLELKLTRETDKSLEISERAKISDNFDADYCISIHHNSASEMAHGWEIYHSAKNSKGKKLAESIGEQFNKYQERHGKGVETKVAKNGTDYYGMIRQPQATAIIIEYAFITKADKGVIDNDQDLVVEAMLIVKGMLNYFGIAEVVEKPKPKPTPPGVSQKIYGRVMSKGGLRVREKRNTDCNILGTLKFGERIRLGELVDGWWSVYFGTSGGWVLGKYIEKEK